MLTTSPTWGRSTPASTSRWRTRVRVPARRPWRTVWEKSRLEVSRFPRVNTGEGLRRPDGCGPYDDATPRWRGRRGYASADGNRASCDGDGCSAGTYACSRVSSPVSGMERDIDLEPGLTASAVQACSAGTARPRPSRRTLARGEQRGLRGHAAPVDSGSTAQRYAAAVHRVKPASAGQPRQSINTTARDTLVSLWTTG